jgi:hypothetical protein
VALAEAQRRRQIAGRQAEQVHLALGERQAVALRPEDDAAELDAVSPECHPQPKRAQAGRLAVAGDRVACQVVDRSAAQSKAARQACQ